MLRIATMVAILLLSGCSSAAFNQPGRVPSYQHPFVSGSSNSTYQPPGSLPP